MNDTRHGTSTSVRPQQLWTVVRDELRERRQERANYRALQRQLASFTTRADVDDLLAAIRWSQGTEVEMMRSILLSNLQERQSFPLAS